MSPDEPEWPDEPAVGEPSSGEEPSGAPAGTPPRHSHRRRPASDRHPYRVVAIVFVVLGVVVIAAVVGGYFWLNGEASPSGPKGPQVIVSVPAGTSTSQFASTLQRKGVIGSSLAFKIWVKLHGQPVIENGAYAFNQNDSFTAVKSVLETGPNVFALDVPPGFTVAEVAARVGEFPGHSEAAFKALATGGTVHSPWEPVGGTNLDGLLGTGEYRLVPGETDTELLTDMIDRFDTLADSLNLTSGAAALGKTPYQVITIASIVEKEGVYSENLGPVSRVIENRLAQDMPLQMNSTVLYALGQDGGTVTSQDLQLQSPYNTYLNKGLTPTPICFPSEASLKAALDPPAGGWLYFQLVKADGTMAFSDTYAEQLANEALAKQRGLP